MVSFFFLAGCYRHLYAIFLFSLFSAPYFSSKTVNSEMKQFSVPFFRINSSRFNFPRRKNTQILVSNKYCIPNYNFKSLRLNFRLSFNSLEISSADFSEPKAPKDLKNYLSLLLRSRFKDFASFSSSSILLIEFNPSKRFE